MSRYSVEMLPAARRQFKKLSSKAQKQIQSVIDLLADNPRPLGYKQLHGKLKDFLRYDTGDYRVIYQVGDKSLILLIVKVGDRKNIYRV